MSIIRRMRRQKCVWWENTGFDTYGKATFADPVEIDCRWEHTISDEHKEMMSELKATDVVYVDREMKEGDMLAFKRLVEIPVEVEDPQSYAPAVRVRRFMRFPNIKCTENLLVCYV